MTTPTNPIDIVILASFLIATLILGIQAGRRVTSFRIFAVGDKDFSTAALTATIIATWISGGGIFYALSNIYATGLRFIIVTLGGTLCLLFTGQVLVVRMGEFLNNLSVAEAMGDLYGPIVRVITGISGILGRIGKLAIQLQVIGKMLAFLFKLQEPEALAISASVVILYSSFGGVRSVTMTDILQLFTFSIFMPILTLIIWRNLEDPNAVVNVLTTRSIFSIQETVKWDNEFMNSLGLTLFFIIPTMSPSKFQRIVMARDVEQAKQAFTYAAGINFLVKMLIAWMAILLLADNPDLNPKKLMDYIIDHYAYVGLKGLMAVGIIAMAMSTADSDLNASAVLAVNDILKPLKLSQTVSITTARVFSFLIGTMALSLALSSKDLLELVLLSANFYVPIVTGPLLLAIFGFRSTTRAVLIGMTAGAITTIIWSEFLAYAGIQSILTTSNAGMFINIAVFLTTHYLLGEEGGWKASDKGRPLAD